MFNLGKWMHEYLLHLFSSKGPGLVLVSTKDSCKLWVKSLTIIFFSWLGFNQDLYRIFHENTILDAVLVPYYYYLKYFPWIILQSFNLSSLICKWKVIAYCPACFSVWKMTKWNNTYLNKKPLWKLLRDK